MPSGKEEDKRKGEMPKFEMLTPAKEAELKENLWKIAKFEKAIKKVSVSPGTFFCNSSVRRFG